MNSPKSLLHCCISEEAGQDMVEYALILLLVSLGAIAGLHSLANVIANVPNALMQQFYTAYNS
ncbi:MAG: Flp family type IVb pilin [Janthinobacterium lividum]